MIRRCAALIASAALAAGHAAHPEVAAGNTPFVKWIDAVEQALHKVSAAKLDAKQAKAAQLAVHDCEQVISDLRSNRSLTKAQKSAKVQFAMRELEGLQAQWEVATVEAALKKVAADPHLAPKQLASAKKVVADVEAALDEVESGKLDAKGRSLKVALAIQKLQGLEHELSNSTSTKETELERKIAEKKALLAKDEKELKLAGLEKELLEQKMQLQKLVAAKQQAENQEKQQQESASEQQQVAKLLAAAKSLAAVRNASSSQVITAAKEHQNSSQNQLANSPTIKAILSDLNTKAKKAATSLAKLDSDYHKREAELKRSIEESKRAPTKGKKDPIARGAEMMQMLLKSEHRAYLKARASRLTEVNELRSGIKSIERGDVASLSAILSKMHHESKLMEAKAKNFLH